MQNKAIRRLRSFKVIEVSTNRKPVCDFYTEIPFRSYRSLLFKFWTLCVYVHPKLIGKRVVDFLLVLIELFRHGWGAIYIRANIGSKSAISLQRGPVDPKFQIKRIAPTNHSSQNTKLNDLSYGVKIWTDLYSILSQSTCLTDFDRRTYRQNELSLAWNVNKSLCDSENAIMWNVHAYCYPKMNH